MVNKVYLCDCMDFMVDKPDGFYDLAVVDPDYGIGTWSHTGGNSLKKDECKKINVWDKGADERYFKELFRVSKYQIIWGANYFLQYLSSTKSFIVWDKKNRGMHFADAELAWANCGSKAVRIFELSVNNKKARIHPTQKPIALGLWLLQNYAQPGWKIFDSHVGSGYMRKACHQMGFYFEGCEIDKDYWQNQEDDYEEFKNNYALIDEALSIDNAQLEIVNV
jgi:site-specific DNA-methyltransferase (adenine-specific)